MAQYRPGNNGLTNNYRANMAILAAAAAGYVILTVFDVGGLRLALPRPGELADRNSLVHFVTFVCAYFLTSYWMSPDLDLHQNRPGQNTFPLRASIRKLEKLGKRVPIVGPVFTILALALTPIHEVLNVVWRLFWHPFGHLFTHRGMVHWPLIGTQLKIAYAFLGYWLVGGALKSLGVVASVPLVEHGLWSDLTGPDGLYGWILSTPLAMTAWIGAMVADICHTAVDAWDSFKKGSRFVPPEAIAPRGIVWSSWRFVARRLF